MDSAEPDPLEFHLRGVEAVLAGTLALMTAASADPPPPHRGLMRWKVARNLSALAEQPGLSGEFRRVVQRLQHDWLLRCGREAGADLRSGVLPCVLQPAATLQ